MSKSLILCLILAFVLVAGVNAELTQVTINQTTKGMYTPEDPIILDVEEDMIAYDSAPQVYYPNLITAHTQFSVRFTPVQACSLTYVQVVSYSGAGNATIHIYDDNAGSPGDDLIAPFVSNLSGNLQYQTINLPTPIDIGDNDFYVAVEYNQAPPPFVTADGDGSTSNRSAFMEPGDPSWTTTSADLNFRAFVIYYGNDQVAPTIVHNQVAFGFTGDAQHTIGADIQDGSGIFSATLHYTTNGTDWNTVDMDNVGGNMYEGSFTTLPAGTSVGYYISAIDASPNSNEAFFPVGGPAAPLIMEVVEGVEIAYDDGSAEGWWIVSDTWDDNSFAMRMTPDSYPAEVLMARARVNDTDPVTFTINDVFAGTPGDVLPGGEAVVAAQASHGWAVADFTAGPTINAGSFFFVFHWNQSTPGSPGVGQDQDNILYRSYWFSTTSGWNLVADGEWMMRVVVSTPTGIYDIDAGGATPSEFQLVGNYPNPFNPSTQIKFLAPEAGQVSIDIYNVAGQLVKNLYDGVTEAGIQAVNWDGTDNGGQSVTSGVYYYKLRAGDITDVAKMVLVK